MVLDRLLLPGPLPAIASIAVVLAVVSLGRLLARWLRPASDQPVLDAAAGCVVVLTVLGALAHGMALAGFASAGPLRVLGLGFLAAGALAAWSMRSAELGHLRREARKIWRQGSWTARWALVCLGLTILGLSLAALGPPTDVDSLDYHLGVPMAWLQLGRADPLPLWYHARLVGLGEGINLLGLALGTDSLGAATQALGLVLAMIAAGACVRRPRDRLLAWLLVGASPVMLFLVPGEKPQLLPAAATALAAVILARRFRTLDAGSLVLALVCLGFAAGSKYSFLMSGGVLAILAIVAAWQSSRLVQAVAIGLGACLLFVAPIYVRNYVFYGDPISPFLESRKAKSDIAIEAFAFHLRTFSGFREPEQFARLAIKMVFPVRWKHVTSALGIGVLAVVLAWRDRRADRRLLTVAAGAAAMCAAFGQLSPRFFLEPYLWMAAAVAGAGSARMRRMFTGALTVQATAVAALALFIAAMIFPGALGSRWREQVMRNCAPGYGVARWLDQCLPADAVVAVDFRTHALLSQPHLSGDLAVMLWKTRLDPSLKVRRLLETFRRQRVTVVVLTRPLESGPYSVLAEHLGPPLAGPVWLDRPRLNLLYRGQKDQVIALRLRDSEAVEGSGKTPIGKE